MNMTDFLIICHGKTEIILSRWLYRQTGARINIDSRNDGKNAIMLNNLIDFMKENGYYSVPKLKKRFRTIEYQHRVGVEDLVIFIVMDVDVDKKLVNDFLTKKMFKGCPLYDCIIPILNDRNLDEVMGRIGLPVRSYNKTD